MMIKVNLVRDFDMNSTNNFLKEIQSVISNNL